MYDDRDFDVKDRITISMDELENHYEFENTFSVAPIEEANLVSSLTPEGMHRPLIDLDIPARLVPSTTEGHSHLYIDIDLTHDQYTKLITALFEAGIIQAGIVNQFNRRGATFARLPSVKKATDNQEG